MTPTELRSYLSRLVEGKLMLSVMIWGPPGIGKSSIVSQIAQASSLSFIDVRLSQLAPTDLRGLPVPDNGISRWYPPEFLPREGKGVLFLDELNMAPPALQGIAQQLILDRRVGSYAVPDGWYIWAAGNRKEDRAAVFDMPSPLANRFLHLDVAPDFESFKDYALRRGFHEQVIAFLSYRPVLLHKIDHQRPSWPSPRSWEMANTLHRAGLSIIPAVGEPTAAEFDAFVRIYASLHSLDDILAGRGKKHPFPDEPSLRYAVAVGLSMRPTTVDEALSAFNWMVDVAPAEWVTLMVVNMATHLRAINKFGLFAEAFQKQPKIMQFFSDRQRLESGY